MGEGRPKLNAAWHREHPMPPKATLQQRIEWHLAHQEHCGCREMPRTVREALDRRQAGSQPDGAS